MSNEEPKKSGEVSTETAARLRAAAGALLDARMAELRERRRKLGVKSKEDGHVE